MKSIDKDKRIAELEAELETLKTILYMMPGNVYWKNTKGEYMGCNYNVAKTLRYNSPKEICGKTIFEVLDFDLAKKVHAVDSAVLTTGKEKHLEEPGIDPEGQGHPALYITQKSPLYNREGDLIGMLGISVDITERKLIEQKLRLAKQKAEAANRAKSEFLALISHELRTPLTSILGFAGFLESGKSLADQKKYTQHIIDSGTYLLSLINNLLDYSRLEMHKFALINAPVNLKVLMEQVLKMLSSTAKLKNLNLKLEYEKTATRRIMADARVLNQILVNLIGNAIKFTAKGHVILKVKEVDATADTTSLLISVEDTGVGIATQEQKSIFKRFYQVENVYKRHASLNGTGLGLAIVKKLLKLMHSKIQVKSDVKQGATFYFTIKFAKDCKTNETATDKSPKRQINKPTISSIQAPQPQILLVEDNELIQLIHKKMLEEIGCAIDTTDTGLSALEMIHKHYDTLFIDIGLPDMDGFKLIEKIRQTHSQQNLPIIALTGYCGEEVNRKCVTAGANQVVTKPISKATFEELLKCYVKKTSAHDIKEDVTD